MKNWLTLLILIVPAGLWAQSLEFGAGYNYTNPRGGMKRNIERGHGVTLDLTRVTASKRFGVGLELDFTQYGSQTERQQYTFDDGSVTETDVNVTNSFTTVFASGRYFVRTSGMVIPYLNGKLGYSFFRTNLTIEDPEDEFSCHPLETDVLQKDNTYVFAVGGGVRFDLSMVFRNLSSETLFVDVNAHMTQGGQVNYMSVDKKANSSRPVTDVKAKFINTQTQVIHEHHVGNVYSSLVEMTEYRFTIVFRPLCGKVVE